MTRFFALACLWSWACWIPMVLYFQNRGPAAGEGELAGIPIWALLLAFVGGYGPTAAGLIFAARESGRDGVRALLRRLLIWRVGVRWHLFAWLAPMAFLLVGMAIYAWRGGALGSPDPGRLALAPVAVFFAVIFGPLGEELGWRGYALPRLQQRYSALKSSIVLGLVWTLSHTPMFWGPGGTVVSGGPVTLWAIGKYALYLLGFSILYTWLFNNTRGSVLLAVIFHTSANAVLPLVAFPDRAENASRLIDEWSVIAIWVAVFLVLLIRGPQKLTRGEVPSP